jgi:hypothetical protein
MKKALAILTALLPVIYAISMQLSVFLIKGDEALFAMLGIFLLIGFLLPVSFSIATAAADKRSLAICNLWFYAGNLLLFAYEIVLWCIRYHEEQIAAQNGAMEGGLGLALLIMIAYMPHWIIYLCVRVAGAISCARSLRGTDGTQGNAVLTGMQLFPITDLISSILVLRKVNRFLSCQQPPIEMK